MSKGRKRRNNLEDNELSKSSKICKKSQNPQSQSTKQEVSSEVDSGFPTTDSSLNDIRTPKKTIKNWKTSKKSKSVPKYETEDIKKLNVSQLLDLGEGNGQEEEEEGTFIANDSGGSSDEDDWEEVAMEEKAEAKDPVIPKEGVNITLEVPGMSSLKQKKKGFDVSAHIKRQMNQVKRELQLLIHKVHVLCWIAHLKFVNQTLNSETLMGVSLSLINNKNLYPPKYADLSYLERIVKWFHSVIELKEFLKNPVKTKALLEQLCHNFSVNKAYCKIHYIYMFVIICRTLGLKTRLVMSFQVVTIRPKSIEFSAKVNSEADEDAANREKKDQLQSISIEGEVKIFKIKNINYFPKTEESKIVVSNKNEVCDTPLKSNSKVVPSGKKKTSKKSKPSNSRASSLNNRKSKEASCPEDSDSDEGTTSKHFKSSSKMSKKGVGGKTKKGESQDLSFNEEDQVPSTSKNQSYCKALKAKSTPRVIKPEEGKGKNRKAVKKSLNKTDPEMKNKVIEKAVQSSDTDSDFVPRSLKKKSDHDGIDRRVFSSDEEDQDVKKRGVDVWVEVFLEAEEKWISVDAVRQKIHCINELHGRATQPVVYVVACNNDSTLKDVTKKYVPHWHSDTRKRRVDDTWWNETMWPYQGPKTPQDLEEDEDIQRQLLDKPLPAVLSEYKDHPLYALKRHLLKFEAIYPPEAPTLGFVRGEPVYARECVVTLRSREVWFKEARVVRLKEQPYKIVKARPKYDKMSGEFKKDLPLELFGFWQTDEYIPPIAVEGIVPRNEFGNVDLFKPCMLPQGTVHLQLPGLNKTAKKLGIDCAAAVTGFEFHSGSSHPILDGFVVCEEFKDVLLDAWNKEIDESNKKNEEKRLKRVYDNWKRLIRGLLIRQRLKLKYAFGDDEDDSKASASNKKVRRKR